MSENSARRQPPRLARPLSDAELKSAGTDTLVREVRAALAVLRDYNRDRARERRARHPWAQVDTDRPHQIFFIDGPRGSGKTALLLTLVEGWKTCAGDSGSERNVARPLPILDFEPLPPGLPLHAWLVEALHEPTRAAAARPENRGRASEGYLDEEPEDLLQRWERLRTVALVGWGDGAVLGSASRDLDDALSVAGEQPQYWVGLAARWEAFVDGLVDGLERTGALPKDALIVAPIDDGDLDPRRARDLFLALRLLRHDRLVFLVAGDRDNLQDAVELAYLRDLPRASARDPVAVERRRRLAREFLRKTLHPAHTWKVPDVALSRVVEEDVLGLGTRLRELRVGASNVAAVLGTLPSSAALTMRVLEQFRDSLRDDPTPLDVVERLLRAFEGRAQIRRAGHTLRVSVPGAQVRPFVPVNTRGFRSTRYVRLLTVERIVYVLRFPDSEPIDLPPDLMLAQELGSRLEGAVHTSPGLPDPRTMPILWARWQGPSVTASCFAGLPEPEPQTGVLAWTHAWAEVSGRLPGDAGAGVVWWHWLRFAIGRAYPEAVADLDLSAVDAGLRDGWKPLLESAWAVVAGEHTSNTVPPARDEAWRTWIRSMLLRLGNPEYGLSPELQMDVLRFVLSRTSLQPTRRLRVLGASYTAALAELRRARIGAIRRDASGEPSGEEMLPDVDAAFPLSPSKVLRAAADPHSWWPWIEVPPTVRADTNLLALRIGGKDYGAAPSGRRRSLDAFLHVRFPGGPKPHAISESVGRLLLDADDPGETLRQLGEAVDGRQASEAAPLMVDLWRVFAGTLRRGRKPRGFGVRIDRTGSRLEFGSLRKTVLRAARRPEAMNVLPGLELAHWDDWEAVGQSARFTGRWTEHPALAWLGALQSFAADLDTDSGMDVSAPGFLLTLDGVGIPHPHFPAWIDHELLSWHVLNVMFGELELRKAREDDPWALQSWAFLCFLARCVELVTGARGYSTDRLPTYLPAFPADSAGFALVARELGRESNRSPPWVDRWRLSLRPHLEAWVPPGPGLDEWLKIAG